MRKRNIWLDVSKSKKQFKINFSNFCQFLGYFEQKSGKKKKKHVFLWFSQKL